MAVEKSNLEGVSPADREVWGVSAATAPGHYHEEPGAFFSARAIDAMRTGQGNDQKHKLSYHFCCKACPNDVTYAHHRTGVKQYADGAHKISTHWALQKGSLHNSDCPHFTENYEEEVEKEMLRLVGGRFVWSRKAMPSDDIPPVEALELLESHMFGHYIPRNPRKAYVSPQELESMIAEKGGIASPYFDLVDISHLGRKRPIRDVVFDPADVQAFVDTITGKPSNFYYLAVHPQQDTIRDVHGGWEIDCAPTEIFYRGKMRLFQPVIKTDSDLLLGGFEKGYLSGPRRVPFVSSPYWSPEEVFDEQIQNKAEVLRLSFRVYGPEDMPQAPAVRGLQRSGLWEQLSL
jgi:hypothetical protein